MNQCSSSVLMFCTIYARIIICLIYSWRSDMSRATARLQTITNKNPRPAGTGGGKESRLRRTMTGCCIQASKAKTVPRRRWSRQSIRRPRRAGPPLTGPGQQGGSQYWSSDWSDCPDLVLLRRHDRTHARRTGPLTSYRPDRHGRSPLQDRSGSSGR